jgi:uncharacterized iron-regulated protein
MMRQLRFFILGLLFCFVLSGSRGMTVTSAYSFDLVDNTTAYLVSKARERKLLLIGTHHRNAFIHNIIASSLPSLMKDGGVKVMFVEIPTSQQKAIDEFSAGRLEVEAIGISEIVTSPSYREVLKEARKLKLAIVAIDAEVPAPMPRDEWMARNVSAYLKDHPRDRGIVIVGARHVLKGIEWMCAAAPSLADYLKDQDTFSVVPWPDADETTLPIAMDVSSAKFTGVKMPLLKAMNVQPQVSLASAADGVILLPKTQ